MIELIRHSVKLNYNNRLNHLNDCMNRPDLITKTQHAREFKTIHINVGRRSGKTTAIESLARPTDLMIVHNYHTMKVLNGRNNFICPINTVSGVVLASNGLKGKIIKKYDWVWIDEPSLCDDAVDINEIYKTIDADLFILLGE